MSNGGEDDFKIIQTTALPDLTEVRLYAETKDHITEGHPEFNALDHPLDDVIEGGVQKPVRVQQSTTSDKSVVFVSDTTTHENNLLIIPVRRIEGTTSGRVQTAYFAADYPGTILWSAGDE